MPTSDDWTAAWQPLIDAIGTDFDAAEPLFVADVVERGAIRRYLETLEFDCALHTDPDVARAHGHADVTVPATALGTFTVPPLWRPGETLFDSDARNAQPRNSRQEGFSSPLLPPTSGYFATNFEAEYLLPVVAGDRLLRRGQRLLACVPKATRVGRGAFVTWQSEILNQHRQVVARYDTTLFRYNPHPTGEAAGDDAAPRTGRATGGAATASEPAPGSGSRTTDLHWEDVAEGDMLPPERFPLTVYRLVMVAGANRDFNAIHHNSEVARQGGAADIYANTLFLMGMWEKLVRTFIGPAGRLHKVAGFQMRSFNMPGDTVTVKGKVSRRWLEGDQGLAEITVWSENRDGVSVGPGRITVSLPRRA